MTRKKPPANVNPLDVIAEQIKIHAYRTTNNALEIGTLLDRAAAICEHGEYEKWILASFPFSLTSAARYRALGPFIEWLGWYVPDYEGTGFDGLKGNIGLSAFYVLMEMTGPIIIDDGYPRPARELTPHERSVIATVVKLAAEERKPVSKTTVQALIADCPALDLVEAEAEPDDGERMPWDDGTPDPVDEEPTEEDDAPTTDDAPIDYEEDDEPPTPERAIRAGVDLLAAQSHLVTQWTVALEGYDAARLRGVVDSLTDVLRKLELRDKAKSDADRAESKARLN